MTENQPPGYLCVLKDFINNSEVETGVSGIPPYLEEAFRYEKSAKVLFESLSNSNQQEHISFINQAKKAETRKRRVIRVINMLYEGKKAT